MFSSKILVAFDGSQLSRKALDKALQVAGTDPAIALHVLHVINPQLAAGAEIFDDGSWYERLTKEGQTLINDTEEKLSPLMNPHTASIVEGLPQKEILRFAQEQQCDLIILGSRGLSGLKEFILGSVSHYVAQHAKVPVLIVK